MFDLTGKTALVTGGSRGLGRAIAVALARQGADVAINYRGNAEAADAVATEIVAMGRRAPTVQGDTSAGRDACEAIVKAAIDGLGSVDILVNNAGITRDKTFHNMTPEIWDTAIKVNLYTAFNSAQAAMPYMREIAKKELAEKGEVSYHRKITFTSSTVAITGNPGQANYTAAKGAIISLTKTLARELGPFRINVNAVAPGFIETRLTAAKEDGSDLGIPEPLRNMAIGLIAIGRAGRPEDLANAHLFLCSAEADFVSGVLLPVTGAQLGV